VSGSLDRGGFALALLLATACGAQDPGDMNEVATLETPIVRGAPDLEHPALAALLVEHSVFCTGLSVSERLVLTAAHCAKVGPSEVRFDVNGGAETVLVPVLAAVAHPEFLPGTLGNDLGMLILERGAPQSSPLSAFVFDAAWVGAPVRVAGFGVTYPGAGDGNEKRAGMTSITSYDANSFRLAAAPSGTCGGDSGGPVYRVEAGHEQLIGVTSSGDAACSEFSRAMRLDAYAEFLAGFTPCSRASDCPPDRRCGAGYCQPLAPGSRELGSVCDAGPQCLTGFCAKGLGVCAARCTASDGSCAEGATCEESFGEFVCLRRETRSIAAGCSFRRLSNAGSSASHRNRNTLPVWASIVLLVALASAVRARRWRRRPTARIWT